MTKRLGNAKRCPQFGAHRHIESTIFSSLKMMMQTVFCLQLEHHESVPDFFLVPDLYDKNSTCRATSSMFIAILCPWYITSDTYATYRTILCANNECISVLMFPCESSCPDPSLQSARATRRKFPQMPLCSFL